MRDAHRTRGSTWLNQPWQKFQIFTDSRHLQEIKKVLYKTINKKGSNALSGMSCRLVPASSALTLSTVGLKKLNDTWLKHNEMVKKLKVVCNEDIQALDDG
jgi:hypothetical protein